MTLVSVVSRFIRLYVFSTEMIIFVACIILLYNFVPHIPVWKYVRTARVKMQLKLGRQNGTVSNSRKFIRERTIDGVFEDKERASWELQRDNVGVFAIQGRRPHMEDRFNVVSDLEHTGASIYGIFDGHGGEFAADFVEKTLIKSMMVRLMQAEKDGVSGDSMGRMLTDQVLEVDRQLLQIAKSTMPVDISGTTSLVALVQNSTLTVANVGDSRGVICDKEGKMIPLSFDHKPHQIRERLRIQQSGGFVSFNGVWRVGGVLATSRAMGDLPLKEKHFLIADPDVLTFDLAELEPRFMILATDGLWDYFSNEEAVEFVSERLSEPHFGAKSLVLQAYYRGSLDNITVMVVDLQSTRGVQHSKTKSS